MAATYKKLNDGTWGVRTDGRCGMNNMADLKVGCKITVTKRDGYKVHDVELGELIETDGDMISLWKRVEK